MKKAEKPLYSLITALPAAFMSAVTMTYILMAEEGFGLSAAVAYPVGVCFAAVLFCVYAVLLWKKDRGTVLPS